MDKPTVLDERDRQWARLMELAGEIRGGQLELLPHFHDLADRFFNSYPCCRQQVVGLVEYVYSD